MRKIVSLLVGAGIGAGIAIASVVLLSPFSGEEFRARWREHLQNARNTASQAQAEKRAELEAQLRGEPSA